MPKISQLGAPSVEALRDKTGISAALAAAISVASASLKGRLDRMEVNAGVISVRDFGAVGDGETDDTDAIRAARDAAEAHNMTLHFPPCADAYMVRGGIRLNGNTRVTGHPLGKVKKFPAYTTTLAEAVVLGQTEIPVTDASGFTVGQDVYIGSSGDSNTYLGTRGEVVAINGNTITIAAYNSASGGIRTAYANPAGILVSSTFPILYTDHVSDSVTVIAPEIIGVHLDGNKQEGEANAYPCSLIHLDRLHTEGSLVTRCILRNSGSDGLSDQGNGRSVIAFNRLYDNHFHGIHIGTTSYGQNILCNYVKGSGQDGVYYCNANWQTVTMGNFIEDCPIGFAEIDSSEGDTILANNVTKGCGVDYQVFGAGGAVQIIGMVSIGNTSRVVLADSTRRVRVQGVARLGTGLGIDFTRCTGGSVDVDFMDWAGPYCVKVSNINASRSSKVRIAGSFHGGATTQPVLIQSSDKVLVNDYVFDCGGTYDVVISAGSGQAASDGTVIGVGIKNKTVNDGGTNTVGAY